MADEIVINAKTQRPSVCNAAEKLLIHERIAAEYVPRIVRKLLNKSVEVCGDDETMRLADGMNVRPAEAQDWDEEYLRLCIAICIVPSVEDAIEHINRHSTKNSEAIVTRDEAHAHQFQRLVDSAVVYWNASTRFSDGGEFGFGAEMGISTQKLHCRGPFALVELTSAKYEVTGNGQVRV
jgi:glutamate-5-semialdehyde dehydrogenase